MKAKELAQRVQDILSETPKQIHKCIKDGYEAKAFRVLTEYANQRVIEELEVFTNTSELNKFGEEVTFTQEIRDRIKELKQ